MKNIAWTVDYKNRLRFVVEGIVEVNSKSETLWNLLASPGHLEKVHPNCIQHTTTDWKGIGSTDIVKYRDGSERTRTVSNWEVGKKIQLIVRDVDRKKQTNVCYTIFELPENNKSRLTITMETDEYKNIPRPFWKLYARKFLFPQYKKYLQGVLLGFVNYFK